MQTITATPNDQQRTDKWQQERLGKFSCSQLYRLMTDVSRPMTFEELAEEKLNGGKKKTISDPSILSDGSLTYIEECISEKLTGKPAKEQFTTAAMQHGIDNEPIAKGIYEAVFDVKVSDEGYLRYSDSFGGSPDGLVDEDGAIEIKCPSRPVHYKYLKFKTLEDLKEECKEYYFQMIGYLIIANRTWIDFVSYSPDYAPKQQLKRLRMNRSEVLEDLNRAMLKIEIATIKLNSELNNL